VGESVTSIVDPQYNAFMYGPILTTLMVPVTGYSAAEQQIHLDALVQWGIQHFQNEQSHFGLSQMVISYGLLSGQFKKPL
jgi:hypothetical protein